MHVAPRRSVLLIDPDRWRRLEPLLDEALDLPDEAREAWLAALRERAPADADAIGALLLETETSWLSTRHRARALGDLLPVVAPPTVGALIGPWRLERPLGEGGMGAVWLATRADGLFTGQVAVKLLHPAMIAGDAAVLFRREADALARLSDPAIARLYDAGVTTAGQPYLVLEYVEGRALDAWCAAQRPSLSRRLELVLQVCDAVTHAHAHGVVHRDIKPGNVIVTADGGVKLLDFGIAVFVGEAATERVQPYTPRYAAPEQRAGGAVTTATDVFALGLVLAELLGLDAPAVRDGSRVGDAEQHEPTPGPVDPDLVAIVTRATQPEPAARYPTVASFADDLRRFRRHEPVGARDGGAWYRARRFVRRHAAGLTVVGVVAGTLVGATVLSLGQAREARAQRNLAVAAERRARAVGEVMLSFMTDLPSADADVRAVQSLRRARRLLDAYLGDDRAERARLALDLSRQFNLFSRREEARGILEDALSDAMVAGDSALAAEATCQRGLVGETRTSSTAPVDFETLAASLPGDAWRARATCAMASSKQLISRMQADSAADAAAVAVDVVEAAGDTVSLFYASLLLERLQVLTWSRGDFHRKLAVYQRTARVLDTLGLGWSVPALDVASEAAAFALDFGRVLVADSAMRDLVVFLEEGERWRAVTPRLAVNLALVAAALTRTEDADRWFARALRQTTPSPNDPIAVRVRQSYARFLAETGRLPAARAHLDTLRRLLAARTNSAFEAARVRTEVALLAAEGRAGRAVARLDSMLRARGYPDAIRLIEWPHAVTEYAHLLHATGQRDDVGVAIARVRERLGRDSVATNGSLLLASLQLLEARVEAEAGERAAAARSAAAAEQALRVAVGAAHPQTRAAAALRDSLAGAN